MPISPSTLQKLNGPIAAQQLYATLVDLTARIEALEAKHHVAVVPEPEPVPEPEEPVPVVTEPEPEPKAQKKGPVRRSTDR